MTPQEMIIWLRGEWREREHGPLPPGLTLPNVLCDLADFIEKHRWRKLGEEKPTEDGEYEVWVTNQDGRDTGCYVDADIWKERLQAYGVWEKSFFEVQAITHWRPISRPEDTDE